MRCFAIACVVALVSPSSTWALPLVFTEGSFDFSFGGFPDYSVELSDLDAQTNSFRITIAGSFEPSVSIGAGGAFVQWVSHVMPAIRTDRLPSSPVAVGSPLVIGATPPLGTSFDVSASVSSDGETALTFFDIHFPQTTAMLGGSFDWSVTSELFYDPLIGQYAIFPYYAIDYCAGPSVAEICDWDSGGDQYTLHDSVAFSIEPIPEPHAAVLFATGTALVAGLLRREGLAS